MKLSVFFFSFIIITVECVQIKKQSLRTYIIQRDNPIKLNRLSTYTVSDSTGIKPLYRLKTISTDIDTIIVIRQSENDMIGNMEGEWIEDVFNVTFSLYDKTLNKWTNGIIKKDWFWLRDKYSVTWNGKSLKTKTSFWLRIMEINTQPLQELLAEVRRRTTWFSDNVNFELKIYSNQFPDIIYFFLIAIDDHRNQISEMENSSEE